jgi:hypothetical protein
MITSRSTNTFCCNFQVAFAVTAGTVGFFISQFDELVDNQGGNGQLALDFGFHGREEFLLFGSGVGFFIAILSMLIVISGLQENVHWAVTVRII